MADDLEQRVRALEVNVRNLTQITEKIAAILERRFGEADPEYSERQAADREWRRFLEEHDELQVWRSGDGDVHLLTGDYFWLNKAELLEALRVALRRQPEGVTAREILMARWGPDAEFDRAASVGSALFSLVRKGKVARLPGRPSRWTLAEEGRPNAR